MSNNTWISTSYTCVHLIGSRFHGLETIQKIIYTIELQRGKIIKINAPVLVIHSMDDEIVPFANGQRLYEAANQPKRFYKIRGGHNECVITYKEDFEKEVRSFLDEIK